MIGRPRIDGTEAGRRTDGIRFLAFGAPALLLIYYVTFLVLADQLTGGQTARAAISPLIFTEEFIDPVGTAPARAHVKAAGDIDGDGLPDVVVGGAIGSGNELYWYHNPTWTKTTIAGSSGGVGFSTDMQVADIDGDGDNDVVVPRANASGEVGASVKWFENPRPGGDPLIDPWTEHHIGDAGAHDLEVDDLNNDGLTDVVVRNDEVNVFLQNDAAADDWTQIVVDGRNTEGLALGDFDNDKDVDIATNGYWLVNPFIPSGAAAMASTWTEHLVYAAANQYSKTHAADIDNDGQLDILLNHSERAGGELAWYEPSDPLDPTAGPWTRHAIDFLDFDHTIQTADMDRDGDLDVVVAEMHQSTDPDEVRIYFNLDGAGTSWDYQTVDSDGSHNLRIVDIDLDGDMDLMGANWSGGPVSLWRNETSLLDGWERHLIDGDRPWTSVLIDSGDLDGDGHSDIVTGGWWYRNPGTPGGGWTRNDIGTPLNNMAAVFDFDGDTDLDILGTTGKPTSLSMVWAENDGSGGFTIHGNVPAGTGDFLQGVTVVAEAGAPIEVYLSWHSETPVQRLTVPADPVSDTWTIDQASADSQGEDLSQGDIDDDTDIDLLLGTQWLENTGSGFVTHELFSPLGAPDRNELADINRDGRLDAVVGYEAPRVAGKLAWYEQTVPATGLWTEHIISDTIIGPMSLDVKDLDGDGDLDVVAGEHNTSSPDTARVIIFENTDGVGGSWTEHIVYTGDEHHDGARTVDIDGDGDLDVISISWLNTPGVFLYENKAGAVPAPDLPVAVADSYSTELDTPLNVSAPGVLANDVTPGTGIAAVLDTDVSDGTLVLNADGSFDYTPDPGFDGIDSFTYVVSNDTDTSPPATVTLTVTLPNLAPVPLADGYPVNRGGLLKIAAPGVLSNDTDPNGDAMQAALVAGPQFGELTLRPDGSFDYLHYGGSDLADSFTYTASDGLLTSDAVTVTLTITAALPREQSGLLALYGFDEGSGTAVQDISGQGTALDLTVQDAGAVSWTTGGLLVNSSTLINSVAAASKISNAVITSNEITVEAWIKPASTSQSGPARMVTVSGDSTHRNITLGQENAEYDVRLRTTTTSDNGEPSTATAGSDVTTDLAHVVYTRDAAGDVVIYINGTSTQTGTVAGDLSNWDANMQLGLANELSSAGDPTESRPWLGEFRLVAVYGAALTPAQVAANFAAGPEVTAVAAGNTVEGSVSLMSVVTGSPAFTFIAPEVTLDSGGGPITVPVGFDGTFSVSVPDGTYTITASAPGFISKRRIGLVVSGATVIMPAVQLLPGLVTPDDVVSGADVSAVLGNIGIALVDRTDGGIPPNIVDLNADGNVTGLDSSLVLANLFESSPQTDW